MVTVASWVGRAVAAVVLCAAVAGCGADASDGSASDPAQELAGRSFTVTEVDDPARDVVPGSTIGLQFTGDSVAVQAGCNSIGGAYEVQDGRLVVDQLGGTEMGCDQPLMAQDAWVTAFLSASPEVTLDDADLELTTDSTTLRLREKLVESPPLEGTAWRLDSLVEGAGADGAVASVPAGAADGALGVEAGTLRLTYGCTTITAPVEVGRAELVAGELSVTSRDCAPRVRDLEQQVRRVLEPPTAYVITGRNLMLSSDDGATGLGFVAP